VARHVATFFVSPSPLRLESSGSVPPPNSGISFKLLPPLHLVTEELRARCTVICFGCVILLVSPRNLCFPALHFDSISLPGISSSLFVMSRIFFRLPPFFPLLLCTFPSPVPHIPPFSRFPFPPPLFPLTLGDTPFTTSFPVAPQHWHPITESPQEGWFLLSPSLRPL